MALFFGLGEEGELDLLAHLLLLAQHAGVFALIAGGELGGDCTLDRAGFNVLGAIPTAALALHCADVLCAVGDAVVVHAPKWAWGHAQVMTFGIGLVVDYLGDFLLVHCFMFFNSSSYSGRNGGLGVLRGTAYRKIEKKKDKNQGWPTKIIGNIEQKKCATFTGNASQTNTIKIIYYLKSK